MADYDPSNKFYRGTKYFLGKISRGRKFGIAARNFDAGPHAYEEGLLDGFEEGDEILWGELRDAPAQRNAGAKWFHDNLPREYLRRIALKFGPAAAAAILSYSQMVTRLPEAPSSSERAHRLSEGKANNHYVYRNELHDLPSDPPPYRTGDYWRSRSEPADLHYIPPYPVPSFGTTPWRNGYTSHVADTYYGSHMLRPVRFRTRIPQSRSVVLTTSWDTCGVFDAVAARVHTIDVGRLSNPFSTFPGVGCAAGVEPAWSVGAPLYNSMYSKHHVTGFELSVDVIPYQAGSEYSLVVGYYDKGYAQPPPPFTQPSEMAAWLSQPTAQSAGFGRYSPNYSSLNDQFSLSWSCPDTRAAFGEHVADDNRTDETSTGTMVVPTDPKYYRIYLAYGCVQFGPAYVPRYRFKLVQYVTFYSPKANVDS